MKKRVTVFGVHVYHPLARASYCRFPDLALRVAVHSACLGHEVNLIVFRGSQALHVPDVDTLSDAPYHDAASCVERVNAFRASKHTAPVVDDEPPDDDDPSQTIITGGGGIAAAPADEMGSLSIEYVTPPPIKHIAGRYGQDWALSLMSALPSASDCVIDASGPDLLNASHVDGRFRADAYAALMRDHSERTEHLMEIAPVCGDDVDQWTQGRTEFPTVQSLVRAIAHHAQGMSTIKSFLQHDAHRYRNDATDCASVASGRQPVDPRRQDRSENMDHDAPLKTWFLNDWRALDVSPFHRVPVVTLPAFSGGSVDGSLSAAMAAGVQHLVNRVWHYSPDIGDWSMLCVPPLLGPAFDVPLSSVMTPEVLIDPTRRAGSFRVTTSECPVMPMARLASVLPPRAFAHVVFSHLVRSKPAADDVAHFLTQNLESRKYGLGEYLSRSELAQREAGHPSLTSSEVSAAKQSQAKMDLTAMVFPTLEGLSSFRFVRRRVGLARSPAASLRQPSALWEHCQTLRQELQAFGEHPRGR